MMTSSSQLTRAVAPVSRETVYDVVMQWAMDASRAQLAACAVGGTIDAIQIAVIVPSWWLLAMPLLCIASVGAWGLAAQKLQAPDVAHAPRRLPVGLKAAKAVTVTIGTLAAIVGFYGILLTILGQRWGPSGG
jgi:hypothetical protein